MTMRIKLTPLSAPRELEGDLVVVEEREEIENISGAIVAAENIPRNWAPIIFDKCLGAVIWRGGYLSHIAILAREFDFPVFRSDRSISKGKYRARIREGGQGWWMYI